MATRNVRARILLTRELPSTPVLEAVLTVWWLGDRFHAREESGRILSAVAGDVTEPRGFGKVPRTMEAIMDSRLPLSGHLDVHGELAAEHAWVTEPHGAQWKAPLERVSPIPAQLFATGLEGLAPSGREQFLGRDCAEYVTHLEGRDDAGPFRSRVRRLVVGPYVLLRDVTAEAGPMRLRAAVTALDEGVVRESDLKP
ncbi:hypothetical protein AB0I28_01655 [Phytomonospora sp. NPDC050363]|uniref:hypothetical protein n=1 Tax=Phytomonospora sp. NPDC050363 TaxID=3155642 RepID=UPI0033E90E79